MQATHVRMETPGGLAAAVTPLPGGRLGPPGASLGRVCEYSVMCSLWICPQKRTLDRMRMRFLHSSSHTGLRHPSRLLPLSIQLLGFPAECHASNIQLSVPTSQTRYQDHFPTESIAFLSLMSSLFEATVSGQTRGACFPAEPVVEYFSLSTPG